MASFLPSYGPTEGPLGFPMLDRQARQLDTLLKSLPKSKDHAYRKAVVAKAPTELNPGERSDVSWISTESVDRMQEVVIARGMNDSQFQANPLVTLQHAYSMPPVGKSLWRKRVKDGELLGIKAKTQYPAKPDSWPEADPWPPVKVLSLVQAGLLNGKSIGFLPLKVHFADEKESKKFGWPSETLVIDEWLLLEYAVCFLPANQDALVESVSKGGLDLPDDFLKAIGVVPTVSSRRISPQRTRRARRKDNTENDSLVLIFSALSAFSVVRSFVAAGVLKAVEDDPLAPVIARGLETAMAGWMKALDAVINQTLLKFAQAQTLSHKNGQPTLFGHQTHYRTSVAYCPGSPFNERLLQSPYRLSPMRGLLHHGHPHSLSGMRR